MKTPIAPLVAFLLAAAATSARSPEIPFERRTIDLGISETCAIADFNGDGDFDFAVGGKSRLFLFDNLTKPARRVRGERVKR